MQEHEEIMREITHQSIVDDLVAEEKSKLKIMKKTTFKNLIINRKRWYRGKGSNYSCLRLSNGKQCCLGFEARQLQKIPVSLIQGQSSPSDVVFEMETKQKNIAHGA